MSRYKREIDTQCCNAWMNGIRTINGQYPDDNRNLTLTAGTGISITPITAGIEISAALPTPPVPGPMTFRGTLGTGGTITSLPPATSANIGDVYVAIESGTVPVTYKTGDMVISNGITWVVIPSGDDPVDWSQILNKPDTIAGYGITDAYTKSEVYSKAETDALDNGKLDKITTGSNPQVYIHQGATQGDQLLSILPQTLSVAQRGVNGELQGANAPSGSTDNTLANTNWVSQTGDSSPNNLVHRTGDETVSGAKTNIGSEIVNGIWANKSVIMQFTSDNTAYRKIYEFNDTSGAQYTTIAFLVTNRRIQNNRIGLLIAGNNRSSSPRLTWMIKSNDIGLTEFVITKENDGTVTLWCKQFGGDADGYHFTRLMENSTGAPVSRWEASQDTNAYNITSSGYTDSNGVTHTFTYYVNSVMIA